MGCKLLLILCTLTPFDLVILVFAVQTERWNSVFYRVDSLVLYDGLVGDSRIYGDFFSQACQVILNALLIR